MKKSELEMRQEAADEAIMAALQDSHATIRISKPVFVVVNLKEPSYRKRLYIVDSKSPKVLFSHHVSHGAGSANPKDKAYAISFSNTPESHQSSLGAMLTTDVYLGKHGRSLRLRGFDSKRNSNVTSRHIVIHPADYVTDQFIILNGRAGCSHGCFAVDPAISDGLIDLVKDGVYLYSYGG